jgi:hypothetical protein
MRIRLVVLGFFLLALCFPASALSSKTVYIGPAGPAAGSSVGVVVKFKKGKPKKVTLFEWNNIPVTCAGGFTSATSDMFGRDIRVNRKRKFSGSSSTNGGQAKVNFSAKISRSGKKITGKIRVQGTLPACLDGDSGRVTWKSVPR